MTNHPAEVALEQRSAPPVVEMDVIASSDTRVLSGALLLAARCIVVAIITLTVGLFVTSLPARYTELSHSAHERMPRALAQYHLSSERYAFFIIALTFIVTVGFVSMSLLIFARRSDEAPAMLASIMLSAFGVALSGTIYAIVSGLPIWDVPNPILQALGWAFLLIFAYLFPESHFQPRWTRFLLIPWCVWVFCFFLLGHRLSNAHAWVIGVTFAVWVAWFITGVFAQAYRYTRISDGIRRQQSKWVALGGLVAIIGMLLASIPSILALSFAHIFMVNIVYQFTAVGVASVSALLIPLSIGIAILRHKLFDIDTLINRALVYGSATALLALLYFGVVIGAQLLARTLTGTAYDLPIVIVLTTLVIAALFQPLRRQLQTRIDRRFYRRKYDAAKTLAAFGQALRTKVELEGLCEQIVVVVEETMQPQHVSLWLRSPTSGSSIDRRDS